MRKAAATRQRLLALGLLGAVLLDYPLLGLAGGGLSGAYPYLFVVWGALIAGAAWLAEKR